MAARGLEKRYGRSRALLGVDLEIERGSAVLVRGPNGAGKSTLLRLLAGLARPSRGELRVLGVNPLAADAAPLRARIGYLGVRAGLYGELTLRENLEFCARLRGAGRAAADRAMAALELEPWAQKPLSALSFGYQRRAGLARALLGDPELVLLDEPWNGLDDSAAERLCSLLAELRRRGTTLLVAAHGVAGREGLFERTARLEGGRLSAA